MMGGAGGHASHLVVDDKGTLLAVVESGGGHDTITWVFNGCWSQACQVSGSAPERVPGLAPAVECGAYVDVARWRES